MTAALTFLIAGALLAGLAYGIWRFWRDVSRRSPEDEEFEREMAYLNDRQANRFKDDQLTRPIDTDTGWQIMVQRGAAASRRRQPPRRQTRPLGQQRPTQPLGQQRPTQSRPTQPPTQRPPKR